MVKVLANSPVQVHRTNCYFLIAALIVIIVYLNVSFNRTSSIELPTIRPNITRNPANEVFNATTAIDGFLRNERNATVRKTYSCYHKNRHDVKVDLLEDIQLSKRQPTLDTSIFFVITTCLSYGIVEIRQRQACAIESAARNNPDRDIFVVFASPVGFAGDSTRGLSDRLVDVPKIIKILSSFQNVHLRNANLTTFIHGTPMEELERKGSVYRSLWPPVHLADVLRLLVLYRYGGIYMDSDVIVMRSFHDLNPVFLSSEENEYLNNGVMGTTHDGFGHGFFHEMIGEGAKGYRNTDWGTIGRDMITRFLQHKCNMTKPGDDNAQCPEIKIYPQNWFHPFAWADDTKVWDTKEPNKEMLNRISQSYAVHLWGSRSKWYDLNVEDKSVVNVVAANKCPTVYYSDTVFDY